MAKGYRLIGGDKLKRALRDKAKLATAKQIVKTNGAEMQKSLVDNLNMQPAGNLTGTLQRDGTRKPPTYTTKRSVSSSISNEGLTFATGTTTEYAIYPEFGTRFMAPRFFMKDAFNLQKEKFKSDLDRLVR